MAGRPSSIARGRPARAAECEDDALLRALERRDEAEFTELVAQLGGPMLRMALAHVGSRAVAEEVVQEAWLTAIRRAGSFERRSSLLTWMLGIVLNVARSRARVERTATPFAPEEAEALVGRGRFTPSDAERWPEHWAIGPVPWPTPEQDLLAGETRDVILSAIAALPPAQREVLVLRDLEGWSSAEACDLLGLTEINQRVLLHRGRSRVRHAIEAYFGATEPT